MLESGGFRLGESIDNGIVANMFNLTRNLSQVDPGRQGHAS
jgi:hypothetical protein